MDTQQCRKCGQDKPLDAFHRDKNRPGGRSQQCKECYAAYHKQWLQLNKDKKAAQVRAWYARRAKKHATETRPPDSTRRCRDCGQDKPLTDFPRHPGRSEGRSHQCRPCNLAYLKAYRETHAEEIAATNREWRRANSAYIRTRNRAYAPKLKEHYRLWREVNPEAAYEVRRDKQLRYTYGIDLEEYAAMLEAQGGVCLICKRPVGESIRQFAVDHDHASGMVRGLLCGPCNAGLGNFRENPDLLIAAAAYIQAFNEIQHQEMREEQTA